jgi:DNA-binding CsgD family transcriptional regulator
VRRLRLDLQEASDMTERTAEALRLREEGLLIREIAERMGVAVSTAGQYLADPDGAKLRARKDSYRGECEDCGRLTDGSNGFQAPRWCRDCVGVHKEAADRRAQHVLEMVRLRREENLTNKEIAARLGMLTSTVATELSRMRSLGFDVPAAPYKNAKTRGAAYMDEGIRSLGRALALRGITP